MAARPFALGLTGLALLFAFSPLGRPLSAEESIKSGKAGCVDFHGDASFATVGYDHIVTLKSDCKVPTTCIVKTDVNPDPTTVDLAPGEEKSIVTWRGSPARVFTPDVACKDKPAAHGG
ncbi:MAG TPA: hypothetical protein VHZ95_02460 [Polyangiales bacterium]|nr:hypothetical protein [Polyangiales bacterium]